MKNWANLSSAPYSGDSAVPFVVASDDVSAEAATSK
jgi:hypothetical protein